VAATVFTTPATLTDITPLTCSGASVRNVAAAENAGVGNCDVDAPELLMSSPHRLLDGIDLGDIAFQRQTSAVW
jgi:hypothetical protein